METSRSDARGFYINKPKDMILETLLPIITALSAIGNIGQWVTIKSMRQKAKYEAEDTHIESLKKIINLQAEEISRLNKRIEVLEAKVNSLQDGECHSNS